MTQENFKVLLELHEEIDELRSKIVDLERATKYEPEMYIPRPNGYSISITHLDKSIYVRIVETEIIKCKNDIDKLTKKFEAL
jgi:hypothetical protein